MSKLHADSLARDIVLGAFSTRTKSTYQIIVIEPVENG